MILPRLSCCQCANVTHKFVCGKCGHRICADCKPYEPRHKGRPRMMGLSPREQQVFNSLLLGHGMSEISRMMGKSVKTVCTYRSRLNEKLGLEYVKFSNSNHLLFAYAREHGLITYALAEAWQPPLAVQRSPSP